MERSAIVPFSPKQMFALVNDVPRYPEFLPWCTGAHSEPMAEGEAQATVKVSKGPLHTHFTTRNTFDEGSRIHMRLVDGPFSRLEGEWRFEAIADRGARVSFRIEFEFKSRLAAAALGHAFEAVCASMFDAFTQRARALYGAA